MDLTKITKASRAYLLRLTAGPGGRSENDLTRSLRTVLDRRPKAKLEAVLQFLDSEDAERLYDDQENPTIHVVIREKRDDDRILVYEDRDGRSQSITFGSLERKLRALRSDKPNSKRKKKTSGVQRSG